MEINTSFTTHTEIFEYYIHEILSTKQLQLHLISSKRARVPIYTTSV